MSRLSIVIPVLDGLCGMEDTLVSVLENRPADCQIIVVLNQPYDDPYDLKEEVLFIQTPRRAKLSTALNLAIAASRAPVVHMLGCGVEVSPGWADEVLPFFDDPQIAAVAPLVLRKDNPQRVIAAGVGYSSAGTAHRLGEGESPAVALLRQCDFRGPDLLAAFYRKSALEDVGALAEGLTGEPAAVDVAFRLRQAGFCCALQPQCRTYADPTHLHVAGALRRGLAAERLFWQWASAAGWPRALVCHALLLASQCLQCLVRPTKVAEVAGRMLAGLEMVAARHRPQTVVPHAEPIYSAPARPHFKAGRGETRLPAARRHPLGA